MAENDNKPKPRPPWERAIKAVAFAAGIACLVAVGIEAIAMLTGRSGTVQGVDIHVHEVVEGGWRNYAVIAAGVAVVAVIWLAARRKR